MYGFNLVTVNQYMGVMWLNVLKDVNCSML